MFASGSLKNFELYLSGINNPWAFNIEFQNKQKQVFEETKQVAQAKSIANQGFPGTSASPGILAKEMMANVQNMPNAVLANATSLSEVITSLVSQMISRSITQGFSSVQRSVSRATSSVNRVNTSINNTVNTYGPGARFDN
jgi:hypothetical protein